MALEVKTEETTTEAAPDRRDVLESAFTEAETAEPELPLGDRARDEKGKFVAKVAQTEQTETPEAAEPVWRRPPQSWKSDYHEAWKTADPKLQEYAFQREEEMRKGVEPLIGKAKFADSMQAAIEPYMPTIRGLGVEPAHAVRALMQADHVLRTSGPEQKRAYFAQLAQQYGVNLSDVAPLQTEAPNPMLSAMRNEITQIRGEQQSWKQMQEQAENQRLQTQIETFSKGKEFFEEARPTMITLLQGGVAATLDDAYDKAVRLDPKLYEKVHAGTQAKQESDRRASKDMAAKAAKAAAVSVKSSTPGKTTTTNAQDRRSMLAEQFDSLSERL